ncbi:hypothetical protein Tco_1416454 [Tanacetum coccineum]
MVLPDNQDDSPRSVLENHMFEISSNESRFDSDDHLNDEEANNEMWEENNHMLYSINEAIKLMLAITTNMSRVIEDIGVKLESKDNFDE